MSVRNIKVPIRYAKTDCSGLIRPQLVEQERWQPMQWAYILERHSVIVAVYPPCTVLCCAVNGEWFYVRHKVIDCISNGRETRMSPPPPTSVCMNLRTRHLCLVFFYMALVYYVQSIFVHNHVTSISPLHWLLYICVLAICMMSWNSRSTHTCKEWHLVQF
jgi:hypothetical protein